jgi:KDO2-lipid IV(A) lauroyltransferase
VQELVEEAYRSYARYWLETFRLVRETKSFFLQRVEWVGKQNMRDAVRAGGAVVVVSHLGNWDAAGASAGADGFKVVTVAEVLRPKRMFDFFAEHRTKLGMTIFPAQPGATDRLAEAARNGAVVAIVGDRDLKGTGPVVDFFGEGMHLPAGPAIVALKSGAALMVAGVYNRTLRDGSPGWLVDMSEPLDIPREHTDENVKVITKAVAQELQRYIARSPADWHVFQPVWERDKVGL